MKVEKCADPECDKPLGEHTEEGREEGGRLLLYRYHICPACKMKQATEEDLKWNAKMIQEFYGEGVKKSMTWQQRSALMRAQVWVTTANLFFKAMFPNPDTWYMRPTVVTDLEGAVMQITANEARTGRVIRRFWEKQ